MAESDSSHGLENAGFWMRWFAFLLDSALITVIFIGAGLYEFSPQLAAFVNAAIAQPFRNDVTILGRLIGSGVVGWMVWWLLQALLCALYYPLFESSELQATPGKLFFRLIVTDAQQNRLSFKQAFVRNAARGTFAVPVIIALPLASVAEQLGLGGAAFMLTTLSIALALFIVAIQHPLAAVTRNKQTLYDLIARTLVVRQESLPIRSYRRRRMVAVCVCMLVQHLAPAEGAKGSSRATVKVEAPSA